MLDTQKGNEFRFQLLTSCKENKFFVLLEFSVACIAQLQCLRSDYLNAIAVVVCSNSSSNSFRVVVLLLLPILKHFVIHILFRASARLRIGGCICPPSLTLATALPISALY